MHCGGTKTGQTKGRNELHDRRRHCDAQQSISEYLERSLPPSLMSNTLSLNDMTDSDCDHLRALTFTITYNSAGISVLPSGAETFN